MRLRSATPRTVPGRYSGSPLTPGVNSPTSKSVRRPGSRSSSLRVRWISKARSAPAWGKRLWARARHQGRPARDAFRHACPGDVGDAAHGAGEPAVVELQGAGQVGALAAVGVVPGGGHGRQFPDGVDVAGPALPHLVAAVVPAEHGIGPLPQLGQLRPMRLPVQADPVRGGGTAGAAASSAPVTVWASSSKRAARSRSPRSPAWSSRWLTCAICPRRAATWAAKAARLSPSACADGSACGLLIVPPRPTAGWPCR